MKLAHFDFENTFSLQPGRVNVLVVEPEKQFFLYCSELCGQAAGEPGKFCLSEGDAELSIAKCCAFIADYFSLQVNDKKFSTKLYRSLQEIAETHFLREYQQICTLLAEFFQKLNAESDCPLEYDGEDRLGAILKAFGVRIASEDTLLQSILLYMRASCAFFKTKCFFFMNLKTVLSAEELAALYHEAALDEVCLFLLENTQREKLPAEVVTIIDRDLCEILA